MGNLIRCEINSWVRGVVEGGDGELKPLMMQVEDLKSEKGIPDYSRFLVHQEDFWCEFMRQVSSQKFLASKDSKQP